jgi:hypothetical protein
VACVESFNLSLKTFDFALYLNVDSNHVSSLCLNTKLQLLEMLQFEPIRRPWGDGEANPVDEANAMRAGIKDKSLALRQKLGKLTAVANPELGDRFLAQVIIIDFMCFQN